MLAKRTHQFPRGALSVLVLAFSCLKIVNGAWIITEKPPYVVTCKIYQPGFTKCSTDSAQKLLGQLFGAGIPQINKKFGSLDPMKFEKVIYKQDNDRAATTEANFTDVLITGFSGIKVKENKISQRDFSWETKVYLPKMRIDGKYKMVGRMLLLPVTGAGKMFIEMENVDILIHTKVRLYEKSSFTFCNVTKVRVDIDMTGLKTYFEDLFNGTNKEIQRATNELFNKNWRDFFQALRPAINEPVERTLHDILSAVYHLIPAKFFVEDIPTSEQLYGKANVVS